MQVFRNVVGAEQPHNLSERGTDQHTLKQSTARGSRKHILNLTSMQARAR